MIDFINALTESLKANHTAETLRRANICASCPEKEQRFYADFVNAEIKEVQGFVCLNCPGLPCPIATKVFATELKNICDKWNK
jgi:hypothetical protein